MTIENSRLLSRRSLNGKERTDLRNITRQITTLRSRRKLARGTEAARLDAEILGLNERCEAITRAAL